MTGMLHDDALQQAKVEVAASQVSWNNVLEYEHHLKRSEGQPRWELSSVEIYLESPQARGGQCFVSPFESIRSKRPTFAPETLDSTPPDAAPVTVEAVSFPPPSQGQVQHNCHCCSAKIQRLTGFEDVSSKFTFCICCKQPLLASAFAENPSVVFSRCRQCALKSPTLYNKLFKQLPVELHSAGQIVSALTAIHRVVQKYEQANNIESLLSGSREVEVEGRSLYIQKARHDSLLKHLQQIRQPRSRRSLERIRQEYFAQWIATERECITIVQKELVLLDELLARNRIKRPPQLFDCLRSLGLTPASEAAVESPVATISFDCACCSALLEKDALPPSRDDEDPAFCDCCQRMVPPSLMTTSLVAAPRITICHRCHSQRDSTSSAVEELAMRPDGRWIQQLCRVALRLQSWIDTPEDESDLPYSPQDLQFQVAKHVAMRARERTDRLKAQQLRALRDGGLDIQRSRQFYSLETEVETALQNALTTFIRVMMLVVPSEQAIGLSEVEKASIRSVYDRVADVPSRVRALVLRVVAPVKTKARAPPVLTSLWCRSCHASVARKPSANALAPAFCDCCQYVWPKESTKAKYNLRLCDACYAAKPTVVAIHPSRPMEWRLGKLSEYVAKIEATLDETACESGFIDAALPDGYLLSAEQEVRTWKSRQEKLIRELQQRVVQPRSEHDDRQLYAEQVQIHQGLFDSLTELMQILVETVVHRRLELNAEMSRLVAALRSGDRTIWDEKEESSKISGEQTRCVEPAKSRRTSATAKDEDEERVPRTRRESTTRSRSRSCDHASRSKSSRHVRRSRSRDTRRAESARNRSRPGREDERSEKRRQRSSSSRDRSYERGCKRRKRSEEKDRGFDSKNRGGHH